MATYGYVRVSTAEQNEDRQTIAMSEMKIPIKRIYTDKISGNYHDVAFPLTGDLRKAISKAVLDEFKQQTSERKQGIGERLEEGKAQAAEYAANAPAKSVAKKAPGLGE